MKKRIDTEAIQKELEGSVFFQQEKAPVPQEQKEAMVSRHHDTVIPSTHDTHSSEVETLSVEEVVRRAVKLLGKEAATYRFTETEKQAMENIKHVYKQKHKILTSENEITRIGLNFILEDYHRNGEESVLAKILSSLNS